MEESSGGRERFERLRHDRPQQAGAKDDLCGDVGFPPPGLDVPLGRSGQRAIQIDRRWRDIGVRFRQTPRACRRNPGAASRCRCAESKPKVVYANIEAEKGRGLYRSDDGGANWTKLDASNYMVWRPFYFGNLIVDPKDENKIFKPDLILLLQQRRRQDFQRGFERGARRLPRRLDRSQEYRTS